jgi:hypothetical protein
MATITPLTFNPTSISGCQWWLDSADSSRVLLSGVNVTQWNDKSGNSRNAVFSLSNYATRVSINSGVSFSNSYYTTTYTADPTNESLFIAFRSQSASNRIILSSPNANGRFVGIPDTGIAPTYSIGFGKDAITWGATVPITSNANVLTTIQFSSGSFSRISANGGSFSNYTALSFNSGSNTNIGGSINAGSLTIPYTGIIYEIIAYNSVLSSNNMQQVEGYLAWKWGLQGSLPTTHPFYYAAPNNQGLTYPVGLRIPAPIQSFQGTSSPFSFFNPTSITGCQVWLDAADSSSITTSGSSITQWRDKSGRGYIGTSTSGRNLTYVASIQNGLNVAQTATGQTLILSNVNLGTTVSVFLLCYPLNQSSGTPFLEHGPNVNTNPGFFIHTQNASQIGMSNTSGSSFTGAYPNYTLSNTWQLLEMVNPDPNASNQFSFYLNADFKFSITSISGSNITQSLYLNGRNNTDSLSYPSYVGELLIYSSALTNTARQQVEGYLAWKWGLQGSLPSNHPFRNGPPGLTMPTPVLTTRVLQQANFSPRNISSCVLWLDAADTSTIVSGAGSVTRWNDKITNGTQHATQGTFAAPTLSTLNGLNVLRYTASSGTGMTMNLNSFTPGTTGFSYFAVFNGTTSSTQNPRIFVSTDRFLFIWGAFSSSSNVGFYTGVFSSSSLTASPNVTNMVSIVENKSNATIFLNGSATGTTSSVTNPTMTSMTLGIGATGNDRFDGSICEYIFFNTNLSIGQQQSVEGYLAWKWGLQGSLPANHPFKNFLPPPN